MLAAAELYPRFPIAMHQDHGNSPATCKSAIEQDFTSVMMDGSLKDDGKTPADFDYNVQVTKAGRRSWPTRRAFRSRANWAASARSNRATARRKTATGPRASSRTINC